MIRNVAENWQLKRSVRPEDLRPFLDTFYAAAMADQRTETVRAFKAVADHIEALQKAKLSPPGMCQCLWDALNADDHLHQVFGPRHSGY